MIIAQINPQVPDAEMLGVASRYGDVVRLQRLSPSSAAITFLKPAAAAAAAKKLDGAAFGRTRVAASLGETPLPAAAASSTPPGALLSSFNHFTIQLQQN